jgi:hypothetical protein
MAWIPRENDERPAPALAGVPLTRAEAIRRRNEDWRADHDDGRYDPVLRRTVRRSLELIALIYNVDKATVSRGIRAARRMHAELSHVDAKDAQ